MKILDKGSYVVKNEQETEYFIEWEKYSALSEEFADRMKENSKLGIESFKEVELDFLKQNPKAVDEDPNLALFKELEGEKLEDAIHTRLEKLFCFSPSTASEQIKSYLANFYYYFITIKEKNSEKVIGFTTLYFTKDNPEKEFKITSLSVKKEKRKQGIATLLINSLSKIGMEIKKLSVSTRVSNDIALKAYTKWGFQLDAEDNTGNHSPFIKGHWIHLSKNK